MGARSHLMPLAAFGVLASFTSSAYGQVAIAEGPVQGAVAVPRPYAIPLPPNANPRPQWEIGMRYWWSEGDTTYDFTSSRVNTFLGDPTSVLSYEDVTANTLEAYWSVRNETRTFFKGIGGGGWLSGGSLDDEDYFTGQIKFSDTSSKVDGDSIGYFTIDIGQDFDVGTGGNITFSPFIGFNYWTETLKAYGARCNKDDIGGQFCGPPGSVLVPFGTEVIKNKAQWSSLRLGAEITARLADRVRLRGDLALLPVAYLENEDSHFLRPDLGRVPNRVDEGTGWGAQLEGELQIDVTDNWAIGAGVRYWYAETDGDTEFVNFGTTVDLNEFTSERFGVFGNVSYRFSTF